MGFSPLIQPSPPGWLTLTGSGLGRSNRPSPFCPAHSSLSRALSPVSPNRLTVARRFRPPLAPSAATTLGQMLASASSSSPTKQIWKTLPLRGDPVLDLARVSPAFVAFELDTSPDLLSVFAAWCLGGWAAQVEVSPMGAPCAAMSPPVKTSLGRAWSAAWALPCHVGQVCTWASGECGSSPLPLPSLLSPLLLAIWPWIAAPSSQTWFYEAATDASLLCWI
jgi:hypothetical protein